MAINLPQQRAESPLISFVCFTASTKKSRGIYWHFPLLDSNGRTKLYKGFVRPVIEYGPLVWLGASDTALGQLSAVQRRALHILGPGVLHAPELASTSQSRCIKLPLQAAMLGWSFSIDLHGSSKATNWISVIHLHPAAGN